jgi:hypothetical protein
MARVRKQKRKLLIRSLLDCLRKLSIRSPESGGRHNDSLITPYQIASLLAQSLPDEIVKPACRQISLDSRVKRLLTPLQPSAQLIKVLRFKVFDRALNLLK